MRDSGSRGSPDSAQVGHGSVSRGHTKLTLGGYYCKVRVVRWRRSNEHMGQENEREYGTVKPLKMFRVLLSVGSM